MAEAVGGIRQKLSRAAEMAKGVQRLHASGIVDLGNLGVTLQTVKNSRVYGPQATMAIQALLSDAPTTGRVVGAARPRLIGAHAKRGSTGAVGCCRRYSRSPW
jgi:hypothetical protein